MSLSINHTSGSREGQEQVFRRDSVLIGRGEANDVAMDVFEDPTVSAQHAEIRIEAGSYVLYDMGSLNGTYLNGKKVRRAELATGDTIGLGLEGPKMCFSVTTTEGAAALDSRLSGSFKRMRPRPSQRTAHEGPIVQLDEEVVSRNPLLYVLLAVLALVCIATAAWFFTR